MKESIAQRNERIKLEKDGLDVLTDILRYAKTGEAINAEDLDRFKWYGIYPQRQAEGELPLKYMMRIKTIDGTLSIEQLRTLGTLSKRYAENTGDFTTRQNVQIHNIQIQDVPAIFDEIQRINLSTTMACGDVPRALVSCPLNGVDHEELIDVTDILFKVGNFLNGNRDFSNLPRKFKIGISGCTNYCIGHEIQDVSFVAVKRNDTGEVVFDLSVGGGLGKEWFFAKRLGRHVKEDQILDVVEKTLSIFRDLGNRDKRHKARLKYLLNDWGADKFNEELEHRLGYSLLTGDEPEIPQDLYRNHFGIHASKTEGKSFVGVATLRGKVTGDELLSIANILDSNGAYGIRLTTNQNFIVLNIPDENAEKVARELDALGFPYNPSPFRAGTLACTGVEFCRLAVSETKEAAKDVVDYLEKEFPGFKEPIRISLNGCPNSCAHYPIVDVGLVGSKFKREGESIFGYEVNLGGHLGGSRSAFVKSTSTKLDIPSIGPYIKSLLEEYLQNKQDNESVQDYLERKEIV